jgi:hypothetical protein
MKSLIKSLKNNWLFYLIFIFLFLIPLFWFDKKLFVLGEDDTGLAYYNTIGTLRQAFSAWYSFDHIPRFEQFVGHSFVFNLLLLSIKTLTFNYVNIQQLAYGFILSFSFLFIVKIIELLNSNVKSPFFYIAGLFYCIAPYFFIVEYYYLMPSSYGIVLAPALAYYLLLALKTESKKPLLIGAIWSFFLSRVLPTPAFINFMGFLLIFVIIKTYIDTGYTHIVKTIKYFILFIISIAFINSILVIPSLFSFMEKGTSEIQQTFSDRNRPEYLLNMVSYMESEIKLNRITSYFTNIFPKSIANLQGFRNFDFYPRYINKIFIFAMIITLFTFYGLIYILRDKKRLIFPILFLYLICFLFISVNITESFKNLYTFLMLKTPIFNMNRIPSMKFHISYLFYFSILVGFCLDYLGNKIFKQYKTYLLIVCFLIIFTESYIFITGKFFTEEMAGNWTKVMDFNIYYKELTRDLGKYVHDDNRMLLFPLGYGYGAFIAGNSKNQTYRATVTGFKSFTGIDLFGNLKVINTVLDESVEYLINGYFYKQNVEDLYTLAKKLNIKYIIYSKDIESLKKFGEIIPSYTYKNVDYLTPVNTSVPVYENNGYVIYKINNYNDISKFSFENKSDQIVFKKIADYMYFAKIKTKSSNILSLHEGYSPNWKTYVLPKNMFDCQKSINYSKNNPQTFECLHMNDNIRGINELIKLLFQPEISYPHNIYNGFENAWKINTNNQYTYVVFIYDGQKYFLLGILFSVMILLLYIYFIVKKTK